MSTSYTLLNGFIVSFGFILGVISLMLLITQQSGEILLAISLLIILIGLQGWQYIQTIVRMDEMVNEMDEIKSECKNILSFINNVNQ